MFLGIFLVIVVIFYFKRGQQNKERPNLILISIDCLGSNHASSYGYYRETTPSMDNFAKEGILFKNYISQSYFTPTSEMSVHTGMYPSSNGVLGFDTVLSKNILTLSEILKIYNYRNAAFGNSPEFALFPLKENFNRGFDVYDFVDYTSPINQENIFSFLAEKKEIPFFLWLGIGSNHLPYGKSSQKFGDLNYEGPLKGKKLDWWKGGVIHWIYSNILYSPDIKNKISLNEKDIQYIIDRYDSDVLSTDEWLGNFLKQLKKTGLDKNTIIIIQSEHGEAFGEKGYIAHYDIFDNIIKTPLLIKLPSLNKKGLIIDNQTQGIDLLPTILDLLDIPKAHQIEGNSLVPLINGQASDNFNEYIFIERPLKSVIISSSDNDIAKKRQIILQSIIIKGQLVEDYIKSLGIEFFLINLKDTAIRTNDWKLIYRKSKNYEEKYSWWVKMSGLEKKMADYELYDLKTDPGEKENVIDRYPDVANELRTKLDFFIKKQENKGIIPQIKKTVQGYF